MHELDSTTKTKLCKKCQLEVPASLFSPDRRNKDGLQPRCRDCQSKAKNIAYWNDRDSFLERQREYRKKNPSVVQGVNKRQREGKNREKILERKRGEYIQNKNNPEWLERQKEYRRKNKDQKREYDRRRHADNPKKFVEKTREWVKSNPEKRKAIVFSYDARRRCQKSNGDSTAAIAEWEKSQKKHCYWCNKPCVESYHIDHYTPLSKGGSHTVDNLVISCPRCNLTKNAKDPYQFAQEKGKLF